MNNSLIAKLTDILSIKKDLSHQEAVKLRMDILSDAFKIVLEGVKRDWFTEYEKTMLQEILDFIIRMRSNIMIFFDDEFTLMVCLIALKNAVRDFEDEAELYYRTFDSRYKKSYDLYSRVFMLFSYYIGMAFDENYDYILDKVLNGETMWQAK